MLQFERSTDGTPWILLAIYVVVTGFAIDVNSTSPFGPMMVMLSLLPAMLGAYLMVLEHLDADQE